MTIEPGQTYVAVGDPYPDSEPRRIKVVGKPINIPGVYGFGKVAVVTLTADGREIRRRAIEATQLHDSPTTRDGKPRRTGYALKQQAFFAWCYSHGRLHRFEGEPWCTASWARLDGTTEAEALADKAVRFGDAQFLHQLPDEQQLELIHRTAGGQP